MRSLYFVSLKQATDRHSGRSCQYGCCHVVTHARPRLPIFPPSAPLHPTVTVEGVLEVVHASAHYSALAAAAAVSLSPLKVKSAAERKSKLPLPPLNPELQCVIGAASAALAS